MMLLAQSVTIGIIITLYSMHLSLGYLNEVITIVPIEDEGVL